MAGLPYFGKGDLFYFAIPSDQLPSTMTVEFFKKIHSLPYTDEKYHFKTKNVVDLEDFFWSYLVSLDPSISKEEVRNFYRGTRMIPDETHGFAGFPEESQFWIIEQEKINKIVNLVPKFNKETMRKFVPDKYYPDPETLRFPLFRNLDEWLTYFVEQSVQEISFIINHLEIGMIVLVVWDQS